MGVANVWFRIEKMPLLPFGGGAISHTISHTGLISDLFTVTCIRMF